MIISGKGRSVYLFLILALTMNNPLSSYSQNDDITQARDEIYQGYINNDPDRWDNGINILKKGYTRTKSDIYRYELASAYYGKIGFLLSQKKEIEAEKLTDRTIALLKDLLEMNLNWAEVHCMLGSAYALKIGMSPSKTLFLGPKSADHIEKAVELDPNCAEAWVEMGNFRFHSPRIFGGNKKEAKAAFEKASRLFELRSEQNYWQYLHAMAWLGKSYEELDDNPSAKQTYEKLLAQEPDFSWARDELLPGIEKKLQK